MRQCCSYEALQLGFRSAAAQTVGGLFVGLGPATECLAGSGSVTAAEQGRSLLVHTIRNEPSLTWSEDIKSEHGPEGLERSTPGSA